MENIQSFGKLFRFSFEEAARNAYFCNPY